MNVIVIKGRSKRPKVLLDCSIEHLFKKIKEKTTHGYESETNITEEEEEKILQFMYD
jgi:hypothetical protein